MKNAIFKHPLLSFFTMAFLFSWIAVLPLLLNHALPVEPFQILGALAGPTLAAVLVIAVTAGKAGLGTFFKRYIQWRAGLIWWLIVLFGALLALTIVAGLIVGPSVITGFLNNLGLILPTYLITLVVGVILGPLWEEPGWRGFALPHLQEQFGPLAGTLILGVVWALWHIPGYLGGWMGAGLPVLIVSSTAFSIIMTWVYNNTRGSILLMILLHSSSNAAISIGSKVLPTDPSASTNALVYSGWIPAMTYTIVAVSVILATRGQLSYRKSESQAARRNLKAFPVGAISQTGVPASLNDEGHIE
jgi:membrane protease YdiL (CAAX protease family)